MTLHWGRLDRQTREEILCNACINTRFAYYEWDEMDNWLQLTIQDNLLSRSKNIVSLIA